MLNFRTPTGSNRRKLWALISCLLCATLELFTFLTLPPSPLMLVSTVGSMGLVKLIDLN